MSKIRKAAKGRDCEMCLWNVCNYRPETTVLAHEPGAGAGRKFPDSEAAFACSDCHDVLDGRVPLPAGMTKTDVMLDFYRAARRTRQILIDEELIILT